MGLIFFSAFYSFLFQVQGLIGPDGILPTRDYLNFLSQHFGLLRYWYAPTLLWFGQGAAALNILCWAGLAASVLLVLNVAPRTMAGLCTMLYISFVAALQDFSSYQSDSMLPAAGFLCVFLAPSGLRPGLGESEPPSRASVFMLLWLWFQIYFESGVAKILGGDPHWRNLTAMDDYYQNGPLPTWIGWYAQQLPHWFHAGTAFFTLAAELVLVWMVFLPRRFRIACFFINLPFQIGIILTANYTFLNYLVIALSFLLLDDRFLERLFPPHLSPLPRRGEENKSSASEGQINSPPPSVGEDTGGGVKQRPVSCVRLWVHGVFLGWIFYNTTALLLLMIFPRLPLPIKPIELLQPLRISDRYGLFAVMTPARYEIEFQGTRDGKEWIPYPFKYKPQDPREPPRIFAPYQPRFDWNLWFASLGNWQQYQFVVRTEERLINASPSVLSLFRSNPFPSQPPVVVRAVFWQYWFTNLDTKRREGLWWRRQALGLYAPALAKTTDGRIVAVRAWP